MDIHQTIPISVDMLAWITTIEIPVLMAMIAYAHRTKSQFDTRLENMRESTDSDIDEIKKAFMDYKLEVAQKYVSMAYLRDVESRLTHHLIRIEKKLDEKYHA